MKALTAVASLVAMAALAVPGTTIASATKDLVVNGAFESGSTGFTSQYMKTATLANPQTYTIGLDPARYNGNWPTIKPHAAVGMLMIVNGAIHPNKTVWSEAIPVKASSSYDFSVWVASLYASPPVLKVEANGSTLGTVTASQTVGDWKHISFEWSSGSARSVKLALIDTNLAFGGNDFALSEIALTGPPA
jgi:hypothetical protein